MESTLSAEELPRYSTPSPARSIHELPSHTFEFKLQHGIGLSQSQDTCTLNLSSHASTSNHVPLFFNGSKVRGSIELELSHQRNIKEIHLKVRGFTRLTGYDGPVVYDHLPRTDKTQVLFLELPTRLWPPKDVESPQKLTKGTHRFHFEFKLPPYFKHHGTEFALPPTFNHKGFPECIAYAIQINIERTLLQSDDVFVSPFRYLPRTCAPSPSALRRLAYSEGTPLLGPDVDPKGWKTFSDTVRGNFFNKGEIEVSYKFSLATPFTYPLGSPIPFIISVSSKDKMASEMLAQPESLMIALQRKCIVGMDATKDPSQPGKIHNVMRSIASVGKCWSPATQFDAQRGTTIWDGEIPIRRDTLPQFVYRSLSVSYAVMLNLDLPGFVPTKPSKDGVLSIPIQITTDAPPGPAAISYVPAPRYGDFTKKEPANGPTIPLSRVLFKKIKTEV